MTRRRARRLELLRLFLSERRDPAPFYRRLAADAVQDITPERLRGATVVDLGCGPGHYTRAMRAEGAMVLPLDADMIEMALPGGPPTGAVVGDARAIPIADGGADGVFCSNMLEHTPDPAVVLAEVERALTPGGWAWLSWTNWYSPWGGHEISPWHYFGSRAAVAIYRRRYGEPPRNVPGESLFPLHVGAMLRLVESRPGLRLLRAVPRYYPSQRWIMAVPGLREVLTWNCLLMLERTTVPHEQAS